MAAPKPTFPAFSMTRTCAAAPFRRTKPCPLLSTTITSKSRRVCRSRDSTHSRSLESAIRVGMATDTRKSGKFNFTNSAGGDPRRLARIIAIAARGTPRIPEASNPQLEWGWLPIPGNQANSILPIRREATRDDWQGLSRLPREQLADPKEAKAGLPVMAIQRETPGVFPLRRRVVGHGFVPDRQGTDRKSVVYAKSVDL